jgi:amino acid adenylation domain-containing protein
LLDRVREAALAAFENRQVAFAAVVEALAPTRSTAHSPFYQVLFQLRRPAGGRHIAAGLDIAEVEPRHAVAAFDLSLDAIETDEGLRLELIFNSDLFERSTAERLLRHFSHLLRAACLDPARPISQLPLLDPAERDRLLAASHAASEPMPAEDFPRMFEAVAAALPDRAAARFAGSEWSYRELNATANRIAHGLRERGIGPGDIVGVALDRSLELLAALLGVLKSGAAFLPLDPHLPPARFEFLIHDSRASLVLGSIAGAVPLAAVASEETRNPAVAPFPGGTAYVLYTSGSTGQPKGVAVPHRALANLLVSMARTVGFGSADSWLATTTISFDISIAELFLPLTLGGSVEIAPDGVSADGQRLAELLDASGCTFWQATPSAWRILLAAGWTGSARLRGICGGEELPLELARRIRPLVGRLWNFYGPTETTIWSMAAEIPPHPQRITLGRPLANTRVYVLDDSLEPQPPGVLGELYIAGAGVAGGYAGRPELTAARFLADPFVTGGRMFRTGDLARLLADDSIEFCGRADAQVKFRGFRIELEEVEKAMARHPDVAAAVVVLHSESDAPMLVCYYAIRGATPSAAELRVFLQRWLPDYMLPSRFVVVPDFPRTANGKLDRKSLATLPHATIPVQPHRAAADPVEQRIAAVCAELLQIDSVAVDADLFDLGAHSMLCAALLERIHREFGCRIPLPVLFEAATVESLAAIVTGRREVEAAPRIVAVRPAGGRDPVFWVKADPMLRALAQRLPGDQTIFGLFLPENDPLPRPYRIADIAAFHLDTLRRQQPKGPYRLGGFCAAGLVAFEMARRLEAAGEEISALILIDTRNPRAGRKSGLMDVVRDHAAQFAEKGPLTYTRDKLLAVDSWVERRRLESRLQQGGSHRSAALAEESNPEFVRLRSAASRYVPGPYRGPVLLVRRPIRGRQRQDLGWGHLIPQLTIAELPAAHLGFFSEPHVSRLAAIVSAHLREAEGQT